MTLLILPAAPSGHRVAACSQPPPGASRPMLLGGLPVLAMPLDGLDGPGWAVGHHVMTGRCVVTLPACDDRPEERAATWVRTLRFPVGPDAERLGALAREVMGDATPEARARRLVRAGEHAAEIADILRRAGGAV